MEGKSAVNRQRHHLGKCSIQYSLWPCCPVGARPQVRAENMGHQAGRLGTWALATSSLPAHYRVEGHRNIQSQKGMRGKERRRQKKDNQVTEIMDNCKAAGC